MYEPFRNHWLAACPSAKLRRKPLPVSLLGEPVVLFRPEPQAGAVALADRCPHRNAPLSAGFIREACLVCPYHGWAFDKTGQCQRIPGLRNPVPQGTGSPAFPVMERDGIIWVSLANTSPPPPYRPSYLADPAAKHDCRVTEVEMTGSLLNTIENFLDATHTHFVHPGLVRSDRHRAQSRVEIHLRDDRVEAAYFDDAPQSGLMSRLFEGQRHSSYGRFVLPGVAEIEIRSSRGVEFAITAYLTPAAENRQRAQVIVAIHRGWGLLPGWLRHLILSPFLQQAIMQDQKIVALQQGNIERFGEERFLSTELDLLRPHIRTLLQNGPGAAPLRREVILEL